ncbi:hypothetical protein HPB48_026474 [Haemaphysalis longicornis]|uniref:YqaJ viral recombinase domain-containing protein n=1 Tax=Haemaphysalis longicornis TaxID=44386 RepID=A0A9J6HBI0_HAELO|nr:hypothetical protein HPB48_026474 [Haemaphysalis longicornis]
MLSQYNTYCNPAQETSETAGLGRRENSSRFFLPQRKLQPRRPVSACRFGKVACNHLMGMLRTVALLQSKGFQEAPQHMACTDLPQQWRVPRGSAIRGSSIQGIDWRRVREGGLSVPKLARPTERRARPRTAEQQAAAKERLCHRMLARNPNNTFARGLLLTPGGPSKETKYGPAPAASPLAYQQALLPHGFSAQLSGIGPVSVPYTQLVPAADLFKDALPWLPASHQGGSRILEKVETSRQASLALERDTRQQSDSATHGISNEPMAAKRYEEVLRTMGHDVTVLPCGLLVNPTFPWLGASPDRLVFDPAEGSYGVLEIKCPYTLRDKKGDELASSSFCSELTENGPRLKRDNSYYAQIVGQMGVSALSWGDFVVYGKDFILIERIRLNRAKWEAMKDQLNYFYFNTLLPFLETGSHEAAV